MPKATGTFDPSLSITNNQTKQALQIPIRDNCINAEELSKFQSSREHDDGGDGFCIYDDGYRIVAPIKSKISHLDANTGTLQYRDYSIEEIFRKYDFIDNFHLLTFGSFPSESNKNGLNRSLSEAMCEYYEVVPSIQVLPKDAPVMASILAGLSASLALRPQAIPVLAGEDIYGKPGSVDNNITRCLAALGIAIAATFCHQHNIQCRPPQAERTFMDNLLIMMGFCDRNTLAVDPQQKFYLESLLVLHSEHGMCNATATFLQCASTRADPISCLIAALAAIYGPLHGGSNIITYKQLQKIGTVDKIPDVIQEAKQRKRRLFGFGHRIYRTVDPRATLLEQFLRDISPGPADANPLLQVAEELNRVVNKDQFFISRKIKANTDLFTVLAYQAIGIPEDLVFPFICLSRTQGFLAHWREFMADSPPVWRPQQIFTGKKVLAQSKL